MSDANFKPWADFAAYMKPSETPFLSHFPSAIDPFEGLPRKKVTGTHPSKAKLYRLIGGLLYGIATQLSKVNEWLEYHSDSTFSPKREWYDHTEVDWDQVSPEERKKRTTITWTFGGSLLKHDDDPE